MVLLSLSVIFAMLWVVYEIHYQELDMKSYIFSFLSFAFGFLQCFFLPVLPLVFWTLFMLILSIGNLGIVKSNMEE